MNGLDLYPGYMSLERSTGPILGLVPPTYEDMEEVQAELNNGIKAIKNSNVYDTVAAFYEQNYVLISIVQTVLILVLFIKLIKR